MLFLTCTTSTKLYHEYTYVQPKKYFIKNTHPVNEHV